MKTVITVYWKITDKHEVYSSLECFVEHNPSFVKSTLEYWISRKRQPYENNEIRIERSKFIARKK